MARIRSLLRVRPCGAATSLPPSALPLRLLASRLRPLRIGAADCDLYAILEADETGCHNSLGRLNALADHRLRLVLSLYRDRSYGDGVVIFDNVHEGAIRASLHRAGRYHHHLFQRVDQQPDVDELTGPEL